jgi:cyclophilin family peptidyl-prolyl cis-trans isomerase
MTRYLTRRALCALGLALLGLTANAQEAAPRVKFVTNAGEFVVEVYPDKAPKTVDNFLQYVRDKHYDGTIFHRVIGNFMIQGGGYDQRYMEKRTRAPVEHEGREALAKGGPRNTVGTLAMARTNAPHSATSQFFINVVDNAFLDPSPQQWGYTVFGKVISGMDTVQKIRSTPTSLGLSLRTCHARPSSSNRPRCFDAQHSLTQPLKDTP